MALAIGALLVAAAVAVWLGSRSQPRQRQHGTALRQWADRVQRELPHAWQQLKLTHAPTAQRGQTPPRPHMHGGGPIPEGWRWRISTPGAVTMADLEDRADRLASALNSHRQLIGALEITRDPRAEGWGTLSVWQRDPLTAPGPIPWAAGERPACVRPGWVCWGRHRDGSHVHAPVLSDVGAMCSLYAGRRGSGKSVGILSQVAQMAAWGWAPPILIDTVRQGADLAVLEPVAAHRMITNPKEALEVIHQARVECKRRAEKMADLGLRKFTRYTPDFPLIPIVVDEVHALLEHDKHGELTKFAQETRAMGGLVVCATQYPLAETMSSTFRQQLAYRLAYRCSNADEGRVILGHTPEGEGPHLLRTGPGSCMADLDGSGVFTMRSWWVPDDWLSRHVRALAPISGAATRSG